MGYSGRLRIRFRWATKAIFIFLLVVSVSGTPFVVMDSSQSDFNDNLCSLENQPIDTPVMYDTSILSSDYQEANTTTSLGFQSTIERFVNTDWNTKSEECIRLDEINGTIDWPKPKPIEDNDVTTIPTTDLNSSTSKETRIESLRGASSGTTLLSDSCSSTSGWIVQNSWAGVVRLDTNGLHWGSFGILIHDQAIINHSPPWPLSTCRRPVYLHEYGHHINILDRHPTSEERYCVNLQCSMSMDNLLRLSDYPFYCAHHWSEHRWPGW